MERGELSLTLAANESPAKQLWHHFPFLIVICVEVLMYIALIISFDYPHLKHPPSMMEVEGRFPCLWIGMTIEPPYSTEIKK